MKIVELFIDWNDQEVDELGVDIMSMVSSPAVGYTWQAFSEDDTMTEAQEYAWELFQQYGETMDVEDIYMQIQDQFEETSVSAIGKAIGALDILGKRDATDEGVIKYQYTGPVSSSTTRNFCRAMVQSNRLYSAEDLVKVGNEMRSRFPSLYPDRSFIDNDGRSHQMVSQNTSGDRDVNTGLLKSKYFQKVEDLK